MAAMRCEMVVRLTAICKMPCRMSACAITPRVAASSASETATGFSQPSCFKSLPDLALRAVCRLFKGSFQIRR